MKVLVVCEYSSLNGGERSFLAGLPRLERFGVEAVVACPEEGLLPERLDELECPRLAFDVRNPAGKRETPESIEARIEALVEVCRPDLVHGNSLSVSRVVGPVLSRIGVPSLGHLRDIVGLSGRAARCLNQNARILAVSEATRSWHLEQGLDPQRVHVAYNGVDLEEFRPRSASGFLGRELGFHPEDPVVLSVGQISMRKGLDVLLDAASTVSASFPRVRFVVVGERFSTKGEAIEFEESLHARVDADLSGVVHFLGPRGDVPELMAESAILAHAARQEPLGRVLLEGAASGLAVVATEVGGTREIFPEGSGSGKVVPVGNANAFAEALLGLLEDDGARRAMAGLARVRAEEAFSIDRAVENLVRHYREVSGVGREG